MAPPRDLVDGARPDWLTADVWPFPLGELVADGRRVVFSDTGGDGPTLLFCHVGLWSFLWGGLVAELADDHRCIVVDVPGSGLSDRVEPSATNLTVAADAIAQVVDRLDLHDITLVLHDLGGLAGLAACADRVDRVAGVAAVNTFGWAPRGVLLPTALRVFGSAPVRGLDAATGWLIGVSSTRFGVGRHLDRRARRAWRRGCSDVSARRATHRFFRDAARNLEVHAAAERALDGLADRPTLTVFGRFGDYFGFRRQWRRRRPGVTQLTVPWGYHFPMCDDPALVARRLREWRATSAG